MINPKYTQNLEKEIECKFYPVDKDAIRCILKNNGFECVCPEIKMRRAIFDRKANPQIKATYIRVRDEGSEGITLSAKIYPIGKDDLFDQRELLVKVDSFEKTVELLQTSGLIMSAFQESLRETWKRHDKKGETEVVIDTWPKLRPYIEIETYSVENLEFSAKQLGFNWDDKITTSVVEVYMKEMNWSKERTFEFIKELKF